MEGKPGLDNIDRKILHYLQRNALMSHADIGVKVGLKNTPVWRRIQKLEESGVIKSRTTILDPQKIGVGVTAFVSVRIPGLNDATARKIAAVVDDMPEVMEAYRTSGQSDYILRVVLPDLSAYEGFAARFTSKIDVAEMRVDFAIGKAKQTSVLPLDHLQTEAA